MSHEAGASDVTGLSITDVDLDALSLHETMWPERQAFLASKGYHLRPRYHPNWVPSWTKDPTLVSERCPDYVRLPLRFGQIDATTTDGGSVYLKQVATNSEELRITRIFSEPLLRGDPQNHCVPVLDTFTDDKDERITYIVMPFLHPMNEPEFYSVGDVVDFVDQVLEGLAFMHRNGVAHRDCARRNIMMEATSLFPEGHHPVLTRRTPDLQGFARQYTRQEAFPPVRYLFIDFGLSSHVPPGQSRLVVGVFSQDKEVPELSRTVPYDAFKLDVFVLGNVFRRHIYDLFYRVEFLRPFVREMTATNPSARPDAEDVLARWKSVRSRLWALHLIRRLRKREEGVVEAFALDIVALLRLSYLLAKRLAKWSVAWLRLLFCL